MQKIKYFSLFSGIGGFELGIHQAYVHVSMASRGKQGGLDVAGGDAATDDKPVVTQQSPTCVGFSEIDKYATQIYSKHFPKHKNYGDITTIDASTLPDFDFLVGGFPCQSFSIAGQRKGFKDTRGTLFFEICRILQARRPKRFLLENVKGLLSHDNGSTFKTIIATLDELGYDVQWQVLNSKNFGVPQNRERVFIVGHLRGTPRPEVFPFGNNDEISNGAREPDAGQSQTQLSTTVRIGMGSKADSTFIDESSKIRRLTPVECERLQGFPDWWTKDGDEFYTNKVGNSWWKENRISDTQRYKVLGNAVTVNVIQAIMEKILWKAT